MHWLSKSQPLTLKSIVAALKWHKYPQVLLKCACESEVLVIIVSDWIFLFILSTLTKFLTALLHNLSIFLPNMTHVVKIIFKFHCFPFKCKMEGSWHSLLSESVNPHMLSAPIPAGQLSKSLVWERKALFCQNQDEKRKNFLINALSFLS